MKREDLALKDFCWSSGRLSSEKITHHRKSSSRTGNAELILRRLDEKQICRQQNLQWPKCHAFISFFFFNHSAPKVHGYKGSWQDFYCISVMIATERSYKNIVQVLHRWFTPSGEASPADGVSLMQRNTADQERLLPAPEYKCPFKKTVLFHSQTLSTHTNMNWDPTNEMYRATKQHINTHIYTDQISHHIHKQTPPADAAPLPVSGVVHCDLSAWSPWRDSLLILTRRGLMQDNPDYEWHWSQ